MGLHEGTYCNLNTNLSSHGCFQVLWLESWPCLRGIMSFIFKVVYLLDPERPEVPVAREVQAVLQALQRCFLEYQGFQGCPVAPEGPGDQEDQGDLGLTLSFL